MTTKKTLLNKNRLNKKRRAQARVLAPSMAAALAPAVRRRKKTVARRIQESTHHASTTARKANRRGSRRRVAARPVLRSTPTLRLAFRAGLAVKSWRNAMNKIRVLAAAAAGYVLGTKAGRQRYEQIKQQAQTMLERPQFAPVKQRLDKVKGRQATTPYPERLPAGSNEGRLSSTTSGASTGSSTATASGTAGTSTGTSSSGGTGTAKPNMPPTNL